MSAYAQLVLAAVVLAAFGGWLTWYLGRSR